IPKRRHVTELNYAEIEETMRVNFLAPARMTLAVLGRMLERGSGTIVNVSSTAGRLGNANESAYSASKFALCGWSEACAVDLWGSGIRVRLVNPGPIDTEIWDELPGNEEPLFDVDKVPASEMAQAIVDAIEGDRFELYLPDMRPFVDAKNADVDKYVADLGKVAAAIRARRHPAGGRP
ncbi:MAG TPA: SDR family NAD(P)-dependent oxidoreductase, partial [Acidimicrobiales bacterium]|nr:SDR family NAD(P)-dependent oxidoreductase [Acidimicrobiales bacterium]